MNSCLVCERINQIKEKTNLFFVAELETGYVVFFDEQFYEGYTLFLCKNHNNELHELNKHFRNKFLKEMSIVAQSVYEAFNPDKLNYELLGNNEPHMHWHLIPRKKTDPFSTTAIWAIPNKQRLKKLSKQKIKELRKKLLITLTNNIDLSKFSNNFS